MEQSIVNLSGGHVMVMVIVYASCADHTSLLLMRHHDNLLDLY